MKVTIFGASGTVGKHIVQQAIDAGMQVTAVVRDADRLQLRHDNLTVHLADVTILDARLTEAVRGCDAVMVALGDGLRGRVRSIGTRNVITAMIAAGVRRLICQSTLGAGESWSNLNWLWRIIFRVPLRRAMADHIRQEACIRESGLDWTIVRPAAFTDGERTGKYRHGFDRFARGLALKISRADVADFMVRQLRVSGYLHETSALSY